MKQPEKIGDHSQFKDYLKERFFYSLSVVYFKYSSVYYISMDIYGIQEFSISGRWFRKIP